MATTSVLLDKDAGYIHINLENINLDASPENSIDNDQAQPRATEASLKKSACSRRLERLFSLILYKIIFFS